jgi:hypothetical protein
MDDQGHASLTRNILHESIFIEGVPIQIESDSTSLRIAEHYIQAAFRGNDVRIPH